MENRVQEVLTINVGSPEGLNDLKHWFYDHGDGSDEGGIITFAAGVFGTWQTDVLPVGTENENQMVVTKWHTSVNHAMTFVGYNDSVRYDYNGDGKYTNDLDITDDGIIDMRDWEIGALLMVNSWGTGWGYFGRAWVMYNTLGYHHVEGGIWAQRTNTIKVFESYEPLLKINGFELQLTEFQFLTLVFSTICLAAAGYVINDYFDLKIDLINKPESVIVSKSISRRTAMSMHIVFNSIGV